MESVSTAWKIQAKPWPGLGGAHLPWDRFAPPLRNFAPPLKSHAPPLGKVSMIDQSENLTFMFFCEMETVIAIHLCVKHPFNNAMLCHAIFYRKKLFQCTVHWDYNIKSNLDNMQQGSDPSKVNTDAKKGTIRGDPCPPRKYWKLGVPNCISELVVTTFSLNFSFYLNFYNYPFFSFLGEIFSGNSKHFLGPMVPWSDVLFSTPAG
jgi:hypothetical protein